MGEIVEVEEGLFSRRGMTRTLCVITVVCWTPIMGYGVYFVTLLAISTESPVPEFGALFLLAILGAIASSFSVAVLWVWRRCDRCRRRLFSDARPTFFAGQQQYSYSNRWFGGWQSGMAVPERDYRATTFFGSYRSAVLLSMAIKGSLRCQWCGHVDGANLDYVVTNAK